MQCKQINALETISKPPFAELKEPCAKQENYPHQKVSIIPTLSTSSVKVLNRISLKQHQQQTTLKWWNRRELSTPEGLNHTDPFNVVSEGVKQDITEAAPTANDIEMVEQANAVKENNINEEFEVMNARVEQMQQMLLAAQQPNKHNQHNQQKPRQMNQSFPNQFQQSYGWNPFASAYPPQYLLDNP